MKKIKGFAVRQLMSSESRDWFSVEKVQGACIKYSFVTKRGTGFLADCVNAPTELWTDLAFNKNVGMEFYSYAGLTAKKFGAIQGTGNQGSYNAMFHAEKRDVIEKLLSDNGWDVVGYNDDID